MMRAFRAHGVTIRLDSELPPTMAEALLGRFPETTEEAVAEEIAIELRFDARAEACADPAATPLFFHGTLRAYAAGGDVELRREGVLLRVARDGRSIRGRVHPRTAEVPHDFANVPLLVAVTLALRSRGLFHLHAAACVLPGIGGVLIPGTAGSGKSTLTLALVAAGAAWLGDDAVLVARRGGGAVVLSFPKPFHVADRTARAHPELTPLLGPCDAPGKMALDPRAGFPGQELERMGPPIALLLPSIADAPRTVLVETSRAEALGQLIESSAMLAVDGMPGVREQLDLLGALVATPRCLRIELGRDLLEDPRLCVAGIARALSARPLA